MTGGSRRFTCFWEGRFRGKGLGGWPARLGVAAAWCLGVARRRASAPRLQTAALREVLDLLKHQRRLVGSARVLVPLRHLRERGVAFFRRRIPVKLVPLRPEKLSERVARRKAHADPVRPEPLDRRSAKVLWLANSHMPASLRCGGWRLQGVGRIVGRSALAIRTEPAAVSDFP